MIVLIVIGAFRNSKNTDRQTDIVFDVYVYIVIQNGLQYNAHDSGHSGHSCLEILKILESIELFDIIHSVKPSLLKFILYNQ